MDKVLTLSKSYPNKIKKGNKEMNMNVDKPNLNIGSRLVINLNYNYIKVDDVKYSIEVINSTATDRDGATVKLVGIEDDVYILHRVLHHTLSEEIKIKILGSKKNTVVII